MTSFDRLSICAMCSYHPSTVSCEGCREKYCMECIQKHREELSKGLDELCNRRNELVARTSESLYGSMVNSLPCMKEIDRWEKDMHEKVNSIASRAKSRVQQLFLDSNNRVRTELIPVSQDLQKKEKSRGYLESDLCRISQKLTELNDMIEKFAERTQIDTSNSKNIDWDSLLFVRQNNPNQILTPKTLAQPRTISYSSAYSSKLFCLIL